MNLENMTTNKFYNVLCNLNDLESVFAERYRDGESYDDMATYQKFLENFFISNNNLTDVYFPMMEVKDSRFYAESLSSIDHLSEVQQIYSDLDVNISKAFNFPRQASHTGACFECIYVMEGRAQFQLEERMFELRAGDFIFHAPGDRYAVSGSPDSIVINLDMRKSYIYEAYPRLFASCQAALNFFDSCFRGAEAGNYLLFHTDNQKDFKEAALRIFIEYLWGDEYRGEIIRGNFEMMVTYLKRYAKGDVETIQPLTLMDKNYQMIRNYLMRNYREATLETTSESVHFSKQYISRIISQTAGTSFSKLLKEIRIAKVEEYLEETSLSLENIAELTGFTSTSYLWRTFKELRGISPSDYRKLKKEQ